jgi:hypothetical protein
MKHCIKLYAYDISVFCLKAMCAQGIVKRYHILYWFLHSPKMMSFWGKSMHILLSYAANGLLPRSNGKIAPWFI